MLDANTNGQPLSQTSISNERAFILAMESLTRRLEKTETDFVGHLQKVEDRLDQLVDLTKTVAVLQQQNAQHNDTLAELRVSFRDTTDKFQTSFSRLHARIDEIQNHQRDKLELHGKETALQIKTTEIAVNNIDKELKTWLNRGLGAWAIFVVVIGIANTIGFRWIDSVDRNSIRLAEVLERSSKDAVVIEQRIQNLEAINKETVLTVKRLVDSQRELEDMISRSSRPAPRR